MKKKAIEIEEDIKAQDTTIASQQKYLNTLKKRKQTDKNLTDAEEEALNTQIGNAVPVKMANKFGKHFKKILK